MDAHTPTTHLDSETLTTLASFGNMADAIVQMNNLLQNERETSNNLRIENTQLKAKIWEESYKVSGKNQCNRTPAMDSSSPVLYHHCSCPATKSSESMETKTAFLESTINKAIHLIVEGPKGEFSSKADTHEENNTPIQGNAVQFKEEYK